MKIRVTEDHIKRGVRRICGSCPIALAIAEADPELSEVRTGVYTTQAYRGDSLVRLMHPNGVAEFVNAFDGGKPVKPFEFEATIVNYGT